MKVFGKLFIGIGLSAMVASVVLAFALALDIMTGVSAASAKPVQFYWSQPFPCGNPIRVTLPSDEGPLLVWTCKD